MKQRPITTLHMIMSADGKIITESLVPAKSMKNGIARVENRERWLLDSGQVQSKSGINNEPFSEKTEVSFVLIDNTHLNERGVEYFSRLSKKFVLVTANANHAVHKTSFDNVSVIFQQKLNFQKMLENLYENHGCKKITIQAGGILNEIFLRNKLFDYVDIMIATPESGHETMPDSTSMLCESEFYKLGNLQLESSEVLDDCIRVRYKVRRINLFDFDTSHMPNR
ncbi:MAG: dihydrofolate reductase family protein [Defluviitaleaceae bacterium]|nr:dihydrofolate reductase family protein [Defluviitaleaceae bacterium]